MTPSIRTFLLINLLLSVTLITSLAIIGNLFLSHKDIQLEYDRQLQRTGIQIRALLTNSPSVSTLKKIQQTLNAPNHLLKPSTYPRQHKTVEFQIWQNKQLILHSRYAPKKPLSNFTPGLSHHWIKNQFWRIYTLKQNNNTPYTIMIGDNSSYREQLENRLTQDSIFIMLITYPFLGLLIWIIVGRGLNSLETIAEEVKHRESDYLEPVDIESVPAEIAPLISELNNLFDRLKSAFFRHERFTSDAAHELKTPLAALSIQTQVALRAETPEDRNEALLKVLGGVNRATHVVQQLLTFSRMCPEAGIKDPIQINISKQISDISAMLAPEAIAKDIEFELNCSEDNVTIVGAPTAIGILLRNLIDNAIRYSNEGSFVKVNVVSQQALVTVDVIDNGPGIPEELRERVFERFFRVIGNKSTGSGLGLGIVQQIVKLHHAKIELLTPSNGQGLQIRVIFHKDFRTTLN